MNTIDLLITDFSDLSFRNAFKRYFAELDIRVKDWDSLFEEMNGDGGNMAYIRKIGDETVGFIQFKPISLENWFFEESYGFIREFWVAEKFRGKGHGTQLLRLAENCFTGNNIRQIILTAEPTEQSFYLSRGYKINGDIKAKNDLAVSVKALKGGC